MKEKTSWWIVSSLMIATLLLMSCGPVEEEEEEEVLSPVVEEKVVEEREEEVDEEKEEEKEVLSPTVEEKVVEEREEEVVEEKEEEEELVVTYTSISIDYSNPELYLKSGTQSSLNEKYTNEIDTQLSIKNNDMKALAEIFHWKQDYFKTYSGGGKLIGQITINQIMEEKELSGCHDHGLVLVSIFRHYGFPAIMVDTAGIQWALDYSGSGLSGHVFVEVYVDNNWVLVNSTSGEYVNNYDPFNPVIPMVNTMEGKGYFVLLKGLDPKDYGITSLQQLKEYMVEFAQEVRSIDMNFPQYIINRF